MRRNQSSIANHAHAHGPSLARSCVHARVAANSLRPAATTVATLHSRQREEQTGRQERAWVSCCYHSSYSPFSPARGTERETGTGMGQREQCAPWSRAVRSDRVILDLDGRGHSSWTVVAGLHLFTNRSRAEPSTVSFDAGRPTGIVSSVLCRLQTVLPFTRVLALSVLPRWHLVVGQWYLRPRPFCSPR
jgi:hypothetical protein